MKVAIIGPFHNDEKHAEEWVSQFAGQTHRDFTLYLVDDASGDQTLARIKDSALRFNLQHRIVALFPNRGPAASRNVAFKAAMDNGNDLLLLLDSDCRIAENWVEQHVQFHRANPEISAAGGAIEGVGLNSIGRADGFCSWFTAIPRTASGEVKKLHLSSTNLSIKANVITATGGFDETLATGEDVAFCRRLLALGYKLYFNSDIVTRHLDRNEIRAARNHHYRWGLHSFTISTQAQGGYYGILKRINNRTLVAALVPLIALLNVAFVLWRYTPKFPKVWVYLPWIAYFKWWNAVGVYHGYVNPKLCLRSSTNTFLPIRDGYRAAA